SVSVSVHSSVLSFFKAPSSTVIYTLSLHDALPIYNYGGVYRDVKLIEVEDTHFDLLYYGTQGVEIDAAADGTVKITPHITGGERSEEHTSELQSRFDLVCRLLLEKKNDVQY